MKSAHLYLPSAVTEAEASVVALAHAATPLRSRCRSRVVTTDVATLADVVSVTTVPCDLVSAHTMAPNTRCPAEHMTVEPFRLLASGTGGLEELRSKLDDTMVCRALVQIQVGSGVFARSKLVSIRFNGHTAPRLLRGWSNARSKDAASLLGASHASVEVTRTKDLKFDLLPEQVQAVDNFPLPVATKFQVAPRKQGQVQKCSALCNPETALQAVGAVDGKLNWVLLKPHGLVMHCAGRGGLDEMKKFLDPCEVLFGVVRLEVSPWQTASRRSISKCVSVHWVGHQVGAVTRGICNAMWWQMAQAVKASCAIAFQRQARCLGDLSIEDLASELRRLTTTAAVCRSTAVRATLTNSVQVDCCGLTDDKLEVTRDVCGLRKAVASVRDASQALNWVLCDCTSIRRG